MPNQSAAVPGTARMARGGLALAGALLFVSGFVLGVIATRQMGQDVSDGNLIRPAGPVVDSNARTPARGDPAAEQGKTIEPKALVAGAGAVAGKGPSAPLPKAAPSGATAADPGVRQAAPKKVDYSSFRPERMKHVPAIRFSKDAQTVTIANPQRTLTIKRPVLSAWKYSAKGTTYWVATAGNDRNSGTSTQSPFLTISRAVAAATRPGDLIYVKAGTYTESIWLNKSGTADRPIVLSCAPGELGQVKIIRPAAELRQTPWQSVVTLQTANYVTINGLVIQGTIGTPGWQNAGQCGILMTNGGDEGVRITNNVIYGNTHCGIKEMGHGGHGFTVEGNVVFENGLAPLDHGIYLASAGPDTINGNIFFNNAAVGIHIYSGSVAPDHMTVTHNLCFGNTVGILQGGGHGVIKYNTCAYNHLGMSYHNASARDNAVDHNIFAFSQSYDVSGSVGLVNTDDYNCVTINDWRAFFNVKRGTHELIGDPEFKDPLTGDFTLQRGSRAAQLGCYSTEGGARVPD